MVVTKGWSDQPEGQVRGQLALPLFRKTDCGSRTRQSTGIGRKVIFGLSVQTPHLGDVLFTRSTPAPEGEVFSRLSRPMYSPWPTAAYGVNTINVTRYF